MRNPSLFTGAEPTGQTIRRILKKDPRRDDFRSIFKENRVTSIHPISLGAMRTEYHPWPTSSGHEAIKIHLGRYF